MKRITQRDLGDALGYASPQFISNMERSICDIPNELMPELCRMLGIPKHDIVDAKISDIHDKIWSYF